MVIGWRDRYRNKLVDDMKKHLNTSTFDFVEARISVEILSLWTKVKITDLLSWSTRVWKDDVSWEQRTEYTVDGIRRWKKLGSAVPLLLLVNLLIWLRCRSDSNFDYILLPLALKLGISRQLLRFQKCKMWMTRTTGLTIFRKCTKKNRIGSWNYGLFQVIG